MFNKSKAIDKWLNSPLVSSYSGSANFNGLFGIGIGQTTQANTAAGFLRSGFKTMILKNCWGTNWGDKGYFYISYYDQMLGKDNALFSKVMNPNIYNVIYEYDPLGWCDSAGASSTTAWFANVFTSTSEQDLRAVSWYVASPDSSYNLYIYTNPANSDPRSGKLVKSLNSSI